MLNRLLTKVLRLKGGIGADEFTLLNITSSSTPQEDNRHLYESTAREILRIMRENAQAEIVVATRSFDTGDGFCCDFTHTVAGDIHVWLNPVVRANPLSKRTFDQLLSDGLIEKVSEYSWCINYKLSKRA